MRLSKRLSSWGQHVPGIRQLLILRKLYLSKTWQSHYSKFAEDVSIERHFPKGYRGFYVDVGCFHPVKYSNTHALYRRGWRGVNIDIDAIKIEAFRIARPRDENVQCAVSDHNGVIPYYAHGWWGSMTTVDKEFAAQMGAGKPQETVCRRLDDVLAQSRFAGRQIDLLTVDAEAHDLEVLRSIDLASHRPRLIAVETRDNRWRAVESSPLFAYLNEYGYDLANWCGLTLLFAHPSLSELSSIESAA